MFYDDGKIQFSINFNYTLKTGVNKMLQVIY